MPPKFPLPPSFRLKNLVRAFALVSITALSSACQPDHRSAVKRPLIVLGIDGGEWTVIEQMWAKEEMPHLRSLAARGVRAELKTAYNSSPVIWTTIATGVRPEVHGITDFVVPTPEGDLPVSSGLRRVPALWNMASRGGKRVAAFGWWASWPAEEIQGGIVVSDRALLDLKERVTPASFLPRFTRLIAESDRESSLFQGNEEAERRDRALAYAATTLVKEDRDLDLLMLYFRSPDVISHRFWKYFEPAAFPPIAEADFTENRGQVERIYRAFDQSLGRLLAAAPHDSNVIVLSDHGFHAAKREEETKVLLDLDLVLERLGYLSRQGPRVDFANTRVYSYASPNFRQARFVRFAKEGREPGGVVKPSDHVAIRKALERDLATITYQAGEPVFYVRDARQKELRAGADFIVGVSPVGATETLLLAGKPFEGAVKDVDRISGTHTTTTHGIFIAAGPDIARGTNLAGIGIHDICPTLLFGLGLPIANDFAGKAWTQLFTKEFRSRHPVRSIPSWGQRHVEGAKTSGADAALLDDLRSLGYIQ